MIDAREKETKQNDKCVAFNREFYRGGLLPAFFLKELANLFSLS
jgi:hypothetical protein